MVRWVHDTLFAAYGPQGWWPGEGGAFEVAVGAVLTQNTAWRNVERALAGLAERGLLVPGPLRDSDPATVAEAIRPSGYFNVKAGRLQALAAAWCDAGGDAVLAHWPTGDLRRWLLGVHGVGRETADDVLLYGFERPIFVVDAYTRRIFARLGVASGDEPYDTLRERVERDLRDADIVARLNEFHALIVRLGKDVCRPRPLCPECPLRRHCPSAA